MRQVPTRELGGYTLLGPLGAGGSGTVYRARDADGRTVALKMLHPHLCADPDARERLAREVANLRKIRHPAVAQMLDAEIDQAEAFVVTELVPGVSLADHVATEGPMPLVQLAVFAEDLRDALATVHAAGVLHRDISPGNVMITEDDGPVLIDFGIAQTVEDPRVTSTGLVTGTPGYVAPELLEGGHPSVAGDWWGWAAVLAFAATGRPPFGRGSAVAALERARAGNVDLAGADPRVAAVLRSALAVDPWRRATPETVVEEIRRAVVRPPAPVRGGTAPTATLDSRLRTRTMPAGPPPPPPPPEGWAPEQAPLTEYGEHLGAAAEVGSLPPRRTGTLLAVALLLAALGAALPVVALLGSAALVVLVRSIGLDAEAVHLRRLRRGERLARDVVRGVVAWPWHLARAVVGAAPALLLAAGVCAGVWLGARALLTEYVLAAPAAGEAPGVVPGNAAWVGKALLAVAVLAALLAAWFGPLARPTRVGGRWALSGLGGGAAAAGVLVLVILAATALVAGLALTQDVAWWPLLEAPGPS